MQFILQFVCLYSFIYATRSAILKTSMTNNYPQIAVIGCGSNKANLYYDVQRHAWVEHLVSSCVENESDILNFCQQAYPSLTIGNIIRLDTELNFENWCELIPSSGDGIPRCKTNSFSQETIKPFRCLHSKSALEESSTLTVDCSMNSIIRSGECLRAEKWHELASLDCANKKTVLNSSIIPLDECGLAQFRGAKFLCCLLKDVDEKNDYETSFDENLLAEDDPLREVLIAPATSTMEPHRKIIAMSLGSREPNWMEDYRRWNSDSGYFADDEDTVDDQEEIKLSSIRKSHLTISEHERFSKEKEEFKRKYKAQIDQLKSRWQKRQNEIQSTASRNPNEGQAAYERSELEFRQDYDFVKQAAARERTRINQLHEDKLDSILDIAKKETSVKLNAVWRANPLKTENIKDALYNYLHVLLRDRIHLVNRYERLRVIDPEQAKHKRVSIHERLRMIAKQINSALNKLRSYSNIQSKIRGHIDTLLSEYDEVNQAADRLLTAYLATVPTTTIKSRSMPLGRDEKNIYPFPSASSNQIESEYDYDKDVDEDDDYDDDDDSTSTTTEIKNNPVDMGASDWDGDIDGTYDIKINADNNEQIGNDIRPLMPINRTRAPRYFLMPYLPYLIGGLLILCIIFGVLIFRILIQRRRKSHYGNQYEKNYVFTEVDCSTPEDKALQALQSSGYENPTYKFFETQTPKC